MALPIFGVTVDGLRQDHFPTISAFSVNTKPTNTAVQDAINDCAGELASVLYQKNVDPVALSADAGTKSPVAYQRCQRAIRVGAAAAAMDAMTQKDSNLQTAYRNEFKRILQDIKTNGYAALGDAPQPVDSAVGPRTHIDELGLTTDDPNVSPDVIPVFHRDDSV